MKVIIIILGLLTFSGCTLIGFFVGSSERYQETTLEKLEPGDRINIYLYNGIAHEGKFVIFAHDTLQIVARWCGTLKFPIRSILSIERDNYWRPLIGMSVGLLLDYAVITSLKSSIRNMRLWH